MICAVSISETESKTQLSILCIYHIHIFFHPDFTVGLGISPNHALRLVGYTTGGELHPALKILIQFTTVYYQRPFLSITPKKSQHLLCHMADTQSLSLTAYDTPGAKSRSFQPRAHMRKKGWHVLDYFFACFLALSRR